MNGIGKIAALLGLGLVAISAAGAVKKAKSSVCSPMMQDLFDQAADELKSENPDCLSTEEEMMKRAGKKISKFRNRK